MNGIYHTLNYPLLSPSGISDDKSVPVISVDLKGIYAMRVVYGTVGTMKLNEFFKGFFPQRLKQEYYSTMGAALEEYFNLQY